jgi:hypothetical protein
MFARLMAVAVPTTLCALQARADDANAIFSHPWEPRLLRFTADGGARVEVFGTKDSRGLAQKITSIRTRPLGQPAATLFLDDRDLPAWSVIEGHGLVRFSWRDDGSLRLTLYDAAGGLVGETIVPPEQKGRDTPLQPPPLVTPPPVSPSIPPPEPPHGDWVPSTPPPMPGPTPGPEGSATPEPVPTAIPPPGMPKAPAAETIPVTVRVVGCVEALRDDAWAVQIVGPYGFVADARPIGGGHYVAAIPRISTVLESSKELLCSNIDSVIDGLCAAEGGVAPGSLASACSGLMSIPGAVAVIPHCLVFTTGLSLYCNSGMDSFEISRVPLHEALCTGMFNLVQDAGDFMEPLGDTPYVWKVHARAALRDCDSTHPAVSPSVSIDLRTAESLSLDIDGCGGVPPRLVSAMLAPPDGKVQHADSTGRFVDTAANLSALPDQPVSIASASVQHSWSLGHVVREILTPTDPIVRVSVWERGSIAGFVGARGGHLTALLASGKQLESIREPPPGKEQEVAKQTTSALQQPVTQGMSFIATGSVALQPGQRVHVRLRIDNAGALPTQARYTAQLLYGAGLDMATAEASLAGSELAKPGTQPDIDLYVTYEQAAGAIAALHQGAAAPAAILQGVLDEPELRNVLNDLLAKFPDGERASDPSEPPADHPSPQGGGCAEVMFTLALSASVTVVGDGAVAASPVFDWQFNVQDGR